jgi:uncharacterized spore protein YtfJ
MSQDSTAAGFESMGAFVEHLRATADAETVYGEPVTQGDRTVVPVARVGYRFGAGFGGGEGGEDGSGFGGGGGGTVDARPAGALEVTPEGTRFVEAERRWPLLAAFALGFLLGWLRRR